jgi:hypothetical protein
MTDIVERLREWRRGVRGQAITPTDALMEEAADEIERLRETEDANMKHAMVRIQTLRRDLERTDKVIDISRRMAIYGATPALWKQLDNALLNYDKERDDD